MAIIRGTNANNTLRGTKDSDLIYGEGGDDYFETGGGSDTIFGGDGNDYLNASLQSEGVVFDGGPGNDTAIGGSGPDTLVASGGLDLLMGGQGDDTYVLDSDGALIYDDGGADRAVVTKSFLLVPGTIEDVLYLDGVQPLPYWLGSLVFPEGGGGRFSALVGASKTMGFTFPTSAPSYLGQAVPGFAAFTADQQQSVRALMSHVSSFIDLRFTETTAGAQPNVLSFWLSDLPSGVGGFAVSPVDNPVGSDVTLSAANASLSLAAGTRGSITLVHEVGHALGLRHPFSAPDAVGGTTPGPYLKTADDNTSNTAMSYTYLGDPNTGAFADLDVAALQWLYGPNPNARAANDTYRPSEAKANFLWDGGGLDTVDLSGFSKGAVVYLEPGYWGFAGASAAAHITAPGQITVNFGTVLENLIGTPFGDLLTGNSTANEILGGAGADGLYGLGGNDRLNGGAGQDVALYTGFSAGYTMTFQPRTREITITDTNAARDGVDTLTGIETLRFRGGDLQLNPESGSKADLVLRVHAMYQIPLPSGLEWDEALNQASSMSDAAYASKVGGALSDLSTSALVDRAFVGLRLTPDLLMGEQATAIPTVLGDIVKDIIRDYASVGDRHFWLLKLSKMLSDLETHDVYGLSALAFNGDVQAGWLNEMVQPELIGLPGV